ncbi:MAG: NAD-dependent epimerase/dehydratase family protein [Anaerolineales bacterium]|nr:MAG: NAD-dependent epimerase/dehydratase family protein [Anaerolineales bacterium]
MTSVHESFADRKIVITGGLGFIGSNLARRLVDLGASVTLVDSLMPEYGGSLFNIAGIEGKVTVNISDVRDQYSIEYLVHGQDYLFNLAGQTSHIDSMHDPYTDLRYCQMLWIGFHSARPWGPTPSANQLCYLQRELTLPI